MIKKYKIHGTKGFVIMFWHYCFNLQITDMNKPNIPSEFNQTNSQYYTHITEEIEKQLIN